MPGGEPAYMAGCEDEPEGNEAASDERATCILRQAGVGC